MNDCGRLDRSRKDRLSIADSPVSDAIRDDCNHVRVKARFEQNRSRAGSVRS